MHVARICFRERGAASSQRSSVRPSTSFASERRREIEAPDVVDLHDVGMRELGEGSRLADQPALLPLAVHGRPHDLDGDPAIEVGVARLVDEAQAARAQLTDHLVAGKRPRRIVAEQHRA
jgi:hypothetical protein